MKPTAIVVGVGAANGLGATLCRRFAAEGHHVLVAGRTMARIDAVVEQITRAGGSAEPMPVDTTQEHEVIALFEKAFAVDGGRDAPNLVVFNAGANRLMDFLSLEAEEFERFWRVGCFGGFLVGREAARRMAPLGRGTILFTGASASLRGKPGFAQFAAAKAGLRMVAQSMAREFGPKGIHVGHVVIDGGIDGPVLRGNWPTVVQDKGEDGMLEPEPIAEAFWMLHKQHPSAWSHEIDLRPFKEPF
jgi:NAD(P)-dependent dehydrogenase (short-subunit alcohol dehydrogenase family)